MRIVGCPANVRDSSCIRVPNILPCLPPCLHLPASLLSHRSNYLYANLLIAPYFAPDASGGSGSGHRRRLAAWVGEAVSGGGGGSSSEQPSLPALMASEVDAEVTRRVRSLFSRPKLALPQRLGGNRRLLTSEGLPEPTAGGPTDDLPQLKVRAPASLAACPPAEAQWPDCLPTCLACVRAALQRHSPPLRRRRRCCRLCR
jgi:hypothetical protein